MTPNRLPGRTFALIMSKASNESNPELFVKAIEGLGHTVVRINADPLIENWERPFVSQDAEGRLTISGDDGTPVEVDGCIVYDLQVANRQNAHFISELQAWDFPVLSGPINALQLVTNKLDFAKFAEATGLPHPDTRSMNSLSEVDDVLGELDPAGRYWFKPARGTKGEDVSHLSPSEARVWASDFFTRTSGVPLLVQEDVSDTITLPTGDHMRRHLRVWFFGGQPKFAFWGVQVGSEETATKPSNVSQGASAVLMTLDGPMLMGEGERLTPLPDAWTRTSTGEPIDWNLPSQCLSEIGQAMETIGLPFAGVDVSIRQRTASTEPEGVVLEFNAYHALYWELETSLARHIVDATIQLIHQRELNAARTVTEMGGSGNRPQSVELI